MRSLLEEEWVVRFDKYPTCILLPSWVISPTCWGWAGWSGGRTFQNIVGKDGGMQQWEGGRTFGPLPSPCFYHTNVAILVRSVFDGGHGPLGMLPRTLWRLGSGWSSRSAGRWWFMMPPKLTWYYWAGTDSVYLYKGHGERGQVSKILTMYPIITSTISSWPSKYIELALIGKTWGKSKATLLLLYQLPIMKTLISRRMPVCVRERERAPIPQG